MARRRLWMRGVLTGIGAAFAASRALAMASRFDLTGKVVLITGGSRGLGLELARAFAARGAQLAICAREPGELAAAKRELQARGTRVSTFICDITHPVRVEAVVRQVVETFGGLDVVVNDAGIIQVGPAETLSLRDFREAMDTNFFGTLHTIWAALPHLRAQGGGRIVNITSIGGAVAVPHLLAYSAAKFAAVGLSTGLCAELARENIVVTTVVPGLMRTGSVDNALFKGQRAKELTLFSVASSLPGLTLSSERAAKKIVRACEQGTRFVTLGAPFKLLRELAAIFPSTTTAALSQIARMLPDGHPLQRGQVARPGRDFARAKPPLLTRANDAAAVRNNEDPAQWH
jgi:NAD(P)-dependent dehydrogenase (short-subunit alcohol dehydrogenase family)